MSQILEHVFTQGGHAITSFCSKPPSHVALVIVVACLFLVPAYNFAVRPHPIVPIPLKTKIKSKRKRQECYYSDSRATLLQGYATYKHEVFGVDANDGLKLVIPVQMIDKLKSHPALSFAASLDNDTLADYTLLGAVDTQGVHTFSTKLNPSLAAYTPVLQDLIKKKLFDQVQIGYDWTSVPLFAQIAILIGCASARFLVGSAASENPLWTELATQYTLTAISYSQALKAWPPVLRPLVYRFLPEHKQIMEQRARADSLVRLYLEDLKHGNCDEPAPMLQHMTSGKNVSGINDVMTQVAAQMKLAGAAIHTTASSLTQTLFDLAARPEFIPELRQEVTEVYKKCNGRFTKQSLADMKKLDSWMKESQRLNSPDLTTFQRKTVSSLTLPGGMYVPKGTKLEMPACAVHTDDLYYPNAAQFDGLRHYRKRQEPGSDHKYQYVSVGPSDLAWGYGRHSCPGRFIADIEIKLALAQILLNYDLKLPLGHERPANIEFEATVLPNPDAHILFRRVKE